MAKTLFKGLGVLERLAGREEPMGISELAADLGLAQSNVHRLLQALVQCGYVQQDPLTRRYRCSMRLWELGARVSWGMNLPGLARPHMERLVQRCRENVHLAILDGMDVLYIDKVDGPHVVRLHTRVGGRAPAYCTGSGKALLACGDDPLAAFPRKPVRYTSRTIVSPAKFRQALARIRKQGYAENDGEWLEDVYSIAAPLFDASGRAPAAIGIAAPMGRMDPETVLRIRPMLLQAAQDISRDLGFRRQAGAAAG